MIIFEKRGKENTATAIEAAIDTAKERKINNIVISSNTGDSAALLIGCGLNVVCVSRSYGFGNKKGLNDMSDETRKSLNEAGITVLTTAHVLSGAERGLSNKFGGVSPVEIMAHTLRMFGQGTKVCVECTVMALDAGLIPYGEPIIALGGTGRGVDTAMILSPEYADSILDTKIHEFICKPFQP